MATALSSASRPPEAGGLPDRLVILLHGYGSDGADLVRSLAPVFARDLPHAEFIAPNAPEVSPNGSGYQWFPISSIDPRSMAAGLHRAASILDDFVATALSQRNLGPDRLALVGFSQGAIMALDRALRRADSARAIVIFSGMLADSTCRLAPDVRRPPVLLVHGTEDPVIRFGYMAETKVALEAAGFPVETVERPRLGHGIDHEGAARAARFLARHLAGP
jgi:phospholipase/carboxylesterase